MVAILFLLYWQTLFGVSVAEVATWLMYLAAVLTICPMGYYMKLAGPQYGAAPAPDGDRAAPRYSSHRAGPGP